MRAAWIGFHQEGLLALRAVLESGAALEAVLTLEPEAAAKRSGAADYHGLCTEFGTRLERVRNINDERAIGLLESLRLDIAFVIGWTQLVGPRALAAARMGMIGAHASMLPQDRGRAPINWALIKDRSSTGNSLIWLADDVDAGDLIDQRAIPITSYDTCHTLYERVAETTRDMVLTALPALQAGHRPGRPQPAGANPPLPGRRPSDGVIDWSRSSRDVYNLIRGVTRPYPGAFGWLDGARMTVWESALLPPACRVMDGPGTVLGPVVSPNAAACGQAVACGDGSVLLLLEIEDADGTLLSGRALSERQWQGRVWSQGPEARAGDCRAS